MVVVTWHGVGAGDIVTMWGSGLGRGPNLTIMLPTLVSAKHERVVVSHVQVCIVIVSAVRSAVNWTVSIP